eukprot:gnl/Dysnectes_brevis/1350_a1517_1752.p1 GENE.gnl/Dysnectes_brevis/1350_a1517_1752~~gnl/Dysnectes_brevis/1350_a1517_1752.p1  ORF type:complete len:305 (+),score=37.46 gnl/Dysnectes_brevis/1350_a1517_1752:180-1094(+)
MPMSYLSPQVSDISVQRISHRISYTQAESSPQPFLPLRRVRSYSDRLSMIPYSHTQPLGLGSDFSPARRSPLSLHTEVSRSRSPPRQGLPPLQSPLSRATNGGDALRRSARKSTPSLLTADHISGVKKIDPTLLPTSSFEEDEEDMFVIGHSATPARRGVSSRHRRRGSPSFPEQRATVPPLLQTRYQPARHPRTRAPRAKYSMGRGQQRFTSSRDSHPTPSQPRSPHPPRSRGRGRGSVSSRGRGSSPLMRHRRSRSSTSHSSSSSPDLCTGMNPRPQQHSLPRGSQGRFQYLFSRNRTTMLK